MLRSTTCRRAASLLLRQRLRPPTTLRAAAAAANYAQAALTNQQQPSASAARRTAATEALAKAAAEDENDYVRCAIQKMLTETMSPPASGRVHNNNNHNPKTIVVSDKALEDAAQAYEYQLEEARSCVDDCAEIVNNLDNYSTSSDHATIDIEEWEREYNEADTAIETSVANLIDFLEALNHATPAQQQQYDSLRQSASASLKELREQLQQLVQLQQQKENNNNKR